jgi:ribosomal protein L37AE/L43A
VFSFLVCIEYPIGNDVNGVPKYAKVIVSVKGGQKIGPATCVRCGNTTKTEKWGKGRCSKCGKTFASVGFLQSMGYQAVQESTCS